MHITVGMKGLIAGWVSEPWFGQRLQGTRLHNVARVLYLWVRTSVPPVVHRTYAMYPACGQHLSWASVNSAHLSTEFSLHPLPKFPKPCQFQSPFATPRTTTKHDFSVVMEGIFRCERDPMPPGQMAVKWSEKHTDENVLSAGRHKVYLRRR